MTLSPSQAETGQIHLVVNLLSVTDGISRLPLSTLNCDQRLLPFADFKSSSLAGINVNRSLLL